MVSIYNKCTKKTLYYLEGFFVRFVLNFYNFSNK